MVFQNDPVQALFQKVIRKQHRTQIINRTNIVGHSLAIGNPGRGKSSGNRREIELRWAAGHKIFCLYDAGRMDMAYFMFPSVSPFWRKPKIERGKIVAARAYPVELLYPVTKDIPHKLPKNAVPFTIPVSDLDENDIIAMVGASAKDSIKGLFTYLKDKVDDETTPEDFVNIMGAGLKKADEDSSDGIKPSHHAAKKLKFDVFQPLLNQGILSSRKAPTALNLAEKIKDRKTISILVLRHCPQNLWGFIVHYFMNHLFTDLAGIGKTKRIKQRTTISLNEVADLLSNDDESGGSSWAISKTIGRIAKQSRTSDMFMILDTQIPQELPDVKDTMNRIYVYNSGVAEVQKAMEIIGISTRTGQITQDDLAVIPRLPPGWYYLFDRETGVSIHKQVWTRSRSYLSGEDFYDVYDKVYGKTAYNDIRPILAQLKAEKDQSLAIWKARQEAMKPKAPPAEIDQSELEEAEADEDDIAQEDQDIEIRKPSKARKPKRTKVKAVPARPAAKPVPTTPAVSGPSAAFPKLQPGSKPWIREDGSVDYAVWLKYLKTLRK